MKLRTLNFAFALGILTAVVVWAANQIGSVPANAAEPASNPAPATTAPHIKFEKTTHDFGNIPGTELSKVEFVFTNTGNATLEVTDVRPGCGCTTAGEWTRKVEPGSTGVIPLQFNGASFVGNVAKSATVTCNDPNQPTTILTLKANIWRPIEVNPQWAILNCSTENPSNSTTVRIINNTDKPLKISDLEAKTEGFAAELKTVKEGKEFEVTVKTVPPYPTGSRQAQITMKTDSTNMPNISIQAWANVQQTVMVIPAQVTLQSGPLPSKVTQTISIRSSSTNLINITDPTCNLKGVELQLTNVQAGRYFVLYASFPAGISLSPSERVEISLKTTHPQHPEIKIPVVQSAPPLPPPPASPLTLSPQYAILSLSPETPSNSATIRITNHTDKPVSISKVQSKNPLFAADIKTLVEGKEYELTVRTVAPFPTNSQQAQISLETTAPGMPVVNVTAWANYQQTIMALPAQLSLPLKMANEVKSSLWIRNNGTNAITLSDPQVNIPGADVKVNTVQPGKYFNLTVSFPPGIEIKPEEKFALTVKTSHPRYPEIKVPIVQLSKSTPAPTPPVPGPTAAVRPLNIR